MNSRRRFLKNSGLGTMAALGLPYLSTGGPLPQQKKAKRFVSTWSHGKIANERAMAVLNEKSELLSSVEEGVRIVESDPDGRSVGLGGLPDNSGRVTLDACIMRGDGASGSVGALHNIEHPISVARAVMEKTQHVMLVGDGARKFALDQGFPNKELLVPETRRDYENWKKQEELKLPPVNHENHDTIGLIGMDENGKMAGACTTSGWAYKMPGRLGDSPIIGAGLFVDEEAGAATASGLGESIIQVAGCHLVVELMRQGMSPHDACKEAVTRISRKHSKWNKESLQACFIALRKDGSVGAYALKKGFQYVVTDDEGSEILDAPYLTK